MKQIKDIEQTFVIPARTLSSVKSCFAALGPKQSLSLSNAEILANNRMHDQVD